MQTLHANLASWSYNVSGGIALNMVASLIATVGIDPDSEILS